MSDEAQIGWASCMGCCALAVILAVLSVVGYACSWVGEAADVAKKEFGASALLKKYEEFKDISAALDAKIASIQVMEGSLHEMEKDKINWTRADKEQYYLMVNETNGMKASFNGLAAEYNSAMSKFNYKFCNVGDLPQGADKPLPREYKSYLIK